MKNSRGLILGEVVYIAIIYHIPDSCVYLLRGYDFTFDRMTGENREFSVVLCKNLMVTIYLVLPWKFFDLAFSLFVQCSMFNAGSMLHSLSKAYFRLFSVVSAVRRLLSNYLPTGTGKSLIFQMALVHM